jgi:hypothetical protein
MEFPSIDFGQSNRIVFFFQASEYFNFLALLFVVTSLFVLDSKFF